MSVPPMDMGIVLTQLALIVLLTALSWFLYQKRASEAAGKALVYRVSEPLLKAYLMFVGSIAAGSATTGSSKACTCCFTPSS